MKLPKKIYLQIRCEKETDLNGLIVQLKVRAGRKNPYYIFFPKTDINGEAALTQDDFIGQFDDHFETGLMDYDGSIEIAEPEIEVSLFDSTLMMKNKKLAMAWPLLKNEKSKWSSRKEQYSYMVSCANSRFKMKPFFFNVEEYDSITVDVETK